MSGIGSARFRIITGRGSRRRPGRLALGRTALEALEGRLEGRRWLVGDRCSIADISNYAYTHVAPDAGYELGPYPAVRRGWGASRPSPASSTTSCRTRTTPGPATAGRSTTVDAADAPGVILGEWGRSRSDCSAASAPRRTESEVPDGAWRLRKARELVKLLALARGHRLHREQAMDALWPRARPRGRREQPQPGGARRAARPRRGARSRRGTGCSCSWPRSTCDAFEAAAAAALRCAPRPRCARRSRSTAASSCPRTATTTSPKPGARSSRSLATELAPALEGSTPSGGRLRLPADASSFVGRRHELARADGASRPRPPADAHRDRRRGQDPPRRSSSHARSS